MGLNIKTSASLVDESSYICTLSVSGTGKSFIHFILSGNTPNLNGELYASVEKCCKVRMLTKIDTTTYITINIQQKTLRTNFSLKNNKVS